MKNSLLIILIAWICPILVSAHTIKEDKANCLAFESFAPPCDHPTAAQNVTTNLTFHSAKLNCNVAATQYMFQYRDNTFIWTTTPPQTSNSFTITNLDPNRKYHWQSKVKCGNSWSAWSVPTVFVTPYPPCSTPTNTQNTTSNITYNSARLNTTASGITWKFRYSKTSTTAWTVITHSQQYADLTGLSMNTKYKWQIKKKCNSGGWSNWSAWKIFKTPFPPCSYPTASENYTSNITPTEATLNATTSAVLRQFRYRKSTSSTWTLGNVTVYQYHNLNGLSHNTKYKWQSRRQCTAGNWSSWSKTETFKTPYPPCSSPTNGENWTTNIEIFEARLNSNATAFYRQFRYKEQYDVDWTTPAITLNQYKDISGLWAGSNYRWQTRRQCAAGNWSSWSATEFFSTPSNLSSGSSQQSNLKTINENATEETMGLELFPNPVSVGMPVELNIRNGTIEAQISVSSIAGKQVSHHTALLSVGKSMVDLPPINSPGLYLITVQSGKQVSTAKLIVIE